MSENKQSILDLLSGSVDNLAEMVEFKAWPTGDYLVSFDSEVTDTGVTLKFKLVEAIELSDPERASELRPDATQNIFCNFFKKDGEDSSYGQGQVRKMVELLLPTFGGNNPLETLENAKGCQLRVHFTERKNDKDPESPYAGLKKAELAD